MTETEIKWLLLTPVKIFFDCDEQALRKRVEEWLLENKDSIEIIAQKEHLSDPERGCITVLIHFNKK